MLLHFLIEVAFRQSQQSKTHIIEKIKRGWVSVKFLNTAQDFKILFFYYSRLCELREDLIFGAYRFLVIGISCCLTSVYCTRGYGTCRPLPLYFYLRNLPQSRKYERDPVSLGFVLIFILIILTLQLLVEMEKRKMSREEQMVVQMAATASKNLEAAQLQLKQDLQHTMKNISIPPDCSLVNVVEQSQHLSKHYALKVTRAVSLFGVLPCVIYIVTFSLENIDGLRPHCTTAFSLFSFGVIAPSVLFCYNSKLRKFVKNFMKSEMSRWKCPKRKRKIQPIVNCAIVLEAGPEGRNGKAE